MFRSRLLVSKPSLWLVCCGFGVFAAAADGPTPDAKSAQASTGESSSTRPRSPLMVSHWLAEKVEEARERAHPAVFPPEPAGLAVVGKNRKVSGSVTFPLSETAIAVSPFDPRRIAVGANGQPPGDLRQVQFVSINGGKTWKSTLLPKTVAETFTQCDPTLAWTSDGSLWAATVEGQRASAGFSLKGNTFRSRDNGATWSFMGLYSGNAVIADRPTLWADASSTSKFKDSLYVTWQSGPVHVTRRRKGAPAWSAPVKVSPDDTLGFGGDIKTDSAGRVYVFWPDASRRQLFVARSDNGGVKFSPPIAVSSIGKPLFDLSVAAAGRSPTFYVVGGAHRQGNTRRAFAAWYDPAPAPATGARIWFSRSLDGGNTWSEAAQVAPRSGAADQFHPALYVDAASGLLVVAFTDTSADPANLKTHREWVASTDFGASWSSPAQVTLQPTEMLRQPPAIYGDYQGISGVGQRFWTVWTDRRTAAAPSVWMAEGRYTEGGFELLDVGGRLPSD